MIEASRKTLELFIEKAETLKNWALSMKKFGGLMGIIRNTEEEEWHFHPEIQGFLLTFRMFIQKGDGIALYLQDSRGQRERPKLLDLPGMSDTWHEKAEQAYNLIATVLHSTPPNLMYNGEPITRWKVLETFLYGYFAHNNQREAYDQWRQDRDLFGNLQLEFTTTVAFISDQIVTVRKAVKLG